MEMKNNMATLHLVIHKSHTLYTKDMHKSHKLLVTKSNKPCISVGLGQDKSRLVKILTVVDVVK